MADKTAGPIATEAERVAFVISPIGEVGSPVNRHASLVLNFIIRKAFTKPDWAVRRADEEDSPDSITAQVIKRIADSDLVIADLTGHNPNVFYELAVAHGFKKPVIHLLSKGERLPFDVIDQRAVFYDLSDPESVDNAIKALRASPEWLDSHPDEVRNPLSTYGAFESLSTREPGDESNAQIASALSNISTRLGRLERETRAPLSWTKASGKRLSMPTIVSVHERESLLARIVEIDEVMATIAEDPSSDARALADFDKLASERRDILSQIDALHA